MEDWMLYVSGGLRLVSPQGEAVEKWPTRKAGELLARLVLMEQAYVGRDEAARWLWPDVEPVVGRTRLKQTAALLRRTVGEIGLVLPEAEKREWLAQVPITTDQEMFERAVCSAGSAADVAGALPFLEAAVALWRGSFLADWEGIWVEGERERWEQQYRTTVLRLSLAYSSLDRDKEALAWAEWAWRADSSDEEAAAVRQLLVRLDRKEAAGRLFHDLEGHLHVRKIGS